MSPPSSSTHAARAARSVDSERALTLDERSPVSRVASVVPVEDDPAATGHPAGVPAAQTTRPQNATGGGLARTAARTQARVRRWVGRLLVALPPLAVLAVDLSRRHLRIGDFELPELGFYLGSAAVGLLFWTSLLAAATRARGVARWPVRALVVLAALVCVGSQLYTFARYGAYMNHRAVLVGTSFLPSIGQQLWFDRWAFARALLPCLAVAIAVPILGARLAPMRLRSRGWMCLDLALVAAIIAAFVSPDRGAEQGQPPDVMYFSAMGQLARARWDHNETVERVHPGPRSPKAVPPVVATPARKRNVIMVVTESVRAQSVCVAWDPDCKVTPFSNSVVKDRIPLTQMRALDSTTAISLAVMWNGLLPTESREDQHTAPLIWEYAHAAGLDTAYYTSQHLLFGNSGTWLEGQRWKRHVSATQIEADATYEVGADDGKLVDFVLGDIGALKEPWFGVVHLSNTHFPYKIDPDDMPFAPQDEATGPGYETEILNRYQDSIYMQDKALARLLRDLRKRPEASRTVVVYVSDHGEQMHEKGAVGHTGTLFDPEVRIPFWIDAPEGSLTENERSSLHALETTPVTHLDVFPTMMDLLGLWDTPELAPFRARVAGESLLRGGSKPDHAIVMTNCTELWACAFKNWGAIKGTKKLIAHQGDRSWNCYDVATDPREEHRLDVSECSELLPLAEGTTFGKRPF